jgi:ethanolamine utilization protein EutN
LRIAIVTGSVTSTAKHECYAGRSLLLVQRVTAEGEALGFPTAAIDYVGAGVGDVILLGAAPGLAATVLDYPKAPVQQLIMGIVDRVDLEKTGLDLGKLRKRFLQAA